jgi:hypothetical protein
LKGEHRLNKWSKFRFGPITAGRQVTVVALMFLSGLAGSVLLPLPAMAQSAGNASTLDLSVIFQPILAVAAAVIAGLLAIYVPRALAAFQARTKIQLTDQQRATVLGAVRTAAGMSETKLDQAAMWVSHVEVSNPTVRAEAAAAINAVPLAAAALNMTVDGVSRMIVGAVDTAAHPGAAAAMAPAAAAAIAPVRWGADA